MPNLVVCRCSEKRKERFICVFVFLLSSPLRLSFVSVVFDFSDSLNDDVPVSPILLSYQQTRIEREKSELLMDVFCVSSFFCLHHQD